MTIGKPNHWSNDALRGQGSVLEEAGDQVHRQGPPGDYPSRLMGWVEGFKHNRKFSVARATFEINTAKSS